MKGWLVALIVIVVVLVGFVAYMEIAGINQLPVKTALTYLRVRAAVLSPFQGAKRQFVREADALLAEFADAETLASNTARIGLAGPISEMQAIRRKAQALEAPNSCTKAKDALVYYMDAMIKAYLAFQSQEAESAIKAQFQVAAKYHEQYQMASMALK